MFDVVIVGAGPAGMTAALYATQARKKVLVDYGFRLPSALDNRPLKFEEFSKKMNQVIYVTATPRPQEIKQSSQIVEQIIRPTGLLDPPIEVRPTKNQVDDLLEEMRLQGFSNVNEIQYAILETSGQISVIQKSEKRTTTPEDFGMKPEEAKISYD